MTLIVIEPTAHGAMAALVVDGRLEDLLVDAPANEPEMEEIHLVRVKRVIPNQGGAHVKLGDGGAGFLREAKGLKEGQLVTAQVSGLAGPGKAVPMTPKVLYRGRYAILTPGAPGINIARALKDRDERARLSAIAEAAGVEGAIIRSKAEGVSDDALGEDVAALLSMQAEVAAGAEAREMGVLAEAPGAELTAWREWPVPEEVIREDGAFDRRKTIRGLPVRYCVDLRLAEPGIARCLTVL